MTGMRSAALVPAAGLLLASLVACATAPPHRAGALPPRRIAAARGPASAMESPAQLAFELVNAERTARGLAPLAVRGACVAAAQEHADDMAERGFFDHDSPTEPFLDRMRRWGLFTAIVGEDIGWAPTPEAVVASWMASAPHRANILNPAFVSSGMGVSGDRYAQCFSGVPGD